MTRATKSRTSQTTINSDAELKADKKDPKGTRYRCSDCGEFFTDQKNFYRSMSPLYAGNNGYFPVCKPCVKKYYDYLIEYFSGNEEKALDRMCSVMDLYYSDALAVASRGNSSSTSINRIASYISKTQMKQYSDKGTTYLDTIKDRISTTIDNLDDVEEVNESGEKVVSQRLIKQWGFGYEPEEYSFLDNHYKTLKTQISDDDPMQEIYIKDMCVTKVMQSRAQKANDADKYDKFQKSYQTTAKAANLKPVEKNNDFNNPDEAWGTYVGLIEQYAPADLYKRPKLFVDMDSIKEYYERFIVRPFKNFFTGSREQDKEFNITLGDDNG